MGAPRKGILNKFKKKLNSDFYFLSKLTDGEIEVEIKTNDHQDVGTIKFIKAKTVWSTKPIMFNNFVITDAKFDKLLDIIYQTVKFDGREYIEIKNILRQKASEVIENEKEFLNR